MDCLRKIGAYARLLRLHRPIGSVLLLWPCLWSLWIAGQGQPEPKIVRIFILGVLVMRSGGCVINDIADRSFDAKVSRTQYRPLVTGEISLTEALVLLCLLGFLAFGLVLQLNVLTLKLAFIGLVLAIVYPFAKRVTHWPQLILGAAFSWSIPMAFAAQTGQIPGVAWLLFVAAMFWTLAYDTIYAMMDKEEDRKLGIKSTALLFGDYERHWIALCQLSMLGLLSWVGLQLQLQGIYYLSLMLVSTLMLYQLYLIRNRQVSRCLIAFSNNGWVGAMIFLGFLLS